MTDEKPFRVTNEQAKKDAVINPSEISFAQAMFFPVTIENYARDLLDSRELIDKQEAIIKEMRGYIANMIEHNSDTIYITEGANILEKTKDYA